MPRPVGVWRNLLLGLEALGRTGWPGAGSFDRISGRYFVRLRITCVGNDLVGRSPREKRRLDGDAMVECVGGGGEGNRRVSGIGLRPYDVNNVEARAHLEGQLTRDLTCGF
jgi:hypothetical protein